MNDFASVSILDLMGGDPALFGVEVGRVCLARLIAASAEPQSPSLLLFDFAGVGSATVSFLREGPLAFRQLLRAQSSNSYPVFANLSPSVADSLSGYLVATRDAVFACAMAPNRQISQAWLVGQLEPKQQLAFDAVRSRGTATAAELAAASEEDDVVPTAWNNRLAALVAKGLLIEHRNGRVKSYSVALGAEEI